MSTTIDSLNFDFTASNINIDGKVDAIIEMMGKLSASLSNVSTTKINNLSKGFETLASGLQQLSGVNADNLSNVVSSIERLGKIDGIKNVTQAVDDMSRSISGVGKAKVDDSNVARFGKSVEKSESAIETFRKSVERFGSENLNWDFSGTYEQAQKLVSGLEKIRDGFYQTFQQKYNAGELVDQKSIEALEHNFVIVSKQIDVVKESLQSFSQNVAASNAQSLNESFADISKNAESASVNVSTLSDRIKEATSGTLNVGKDWIPPESIDARSKALAEMLLQMNAITSTLSKGVNANEVEGLTRAYDTLRERVSQIKLPENSLKEFSANLSDIINKTNESPLVNGRLNPKIDWSSLQIGQDRLDGISEAANRVRINFDSISKFQLPQLTFGTRFTDEARELINNINQAEQSIAKLRARVEKMQALKGLDSLGAKSLQADYERQVSVYNKILDQFKQMQTSGKVFERIRDVMSGLNFEPTSLKSGEKYTQAYRRLVSQIESAQKALVRLGETQARMVHFSEDFGKGWEKTQYDIDRAREKLSAYISQARELESKGADVSTGIGMNKTAVSFGSASSVLKKAFSDIFSTMKKVLSMFVSFGAKGVKVFTSLASAITNGTLVALKKLGSAIGSAAKKLTDLSGISKMFTNQNIFGKIEKALKRVATLTVFMFLRTTIRNMMNSMREGLDNIVQVSERANAALSSFASNSNYMKNSLAAMVTPILYAIYPALEKLTDMLAHAANTVGMFFAAITGQNTFTKAKRVQIDYAASLNKTTDSAKKLHKQLAGFDDLNNLTTSSAQQQNDNMLPTVQDMFEEVEIPNNIQSLADKIKDILKTDDWSELGKMLAEKLNDAMRNIPWDKINQEAQRIAKGIGTAINGFVDNLDWDLLGRTIAKGINTGLNFANTLLETINFEKLGKSLGTAFKGFIDELDWEALGRFFANKYNAIIDTLHGFMTEMVDAWYGFGDKVGLAVDSFINQLHLQEALEIIAMGLNGIAEFIIGFVDGWIDKAKGWGEKIGSAVANMFSMIEWERIGEAVDKGLLMVVTVFEGFLDAMEGTWEEIGKGLSEFIERAFNPETFERAGTVIARVINGIIDVFKNLFANKQMWENIGTSLGNFVNSIVNGINWDEAVQMVVNFVNGLFIALENFTKQIDWKKLAKSLADGINSFIRGVDWERAGRTFSEFVLSVLNTIHDVAKKVDWVAFGRGIGTFLSQINWTEVLTLAFDTIWTVLKGLISGLLDTNGGKVVLAIAAGIAGIKLFLQGLGLALQGLLFNLFVTGGIGITAGTAGWGGLITGALGKVGTVGGAAAGGAVSKIGGIFAAAGTTGGAIGIGLAVLAGCVALNMDNIKRRWEESSGGFSGFVHQTVEGFDSVTRVLTTIFFPALSGALDKFLDFKHKIIDGILEIAKKVPNYLKEGWEKAKRYTSERWNDIKDTVGSAFEFFKTKSSEAFKKVADNIKGAWDNVKTTASTLWGEIKTNITGVWNGIKTKAEEIFNEIAGKINGAWSNIKETAKTAWEGVKTTVVTIWEGIKSKSEEVFDGIKSNVSGAWDSIKETAGTAWEGIKTTIETLWNGLKENAGTAFDGIAEKVNGSWGNIKETASTLWGEIKGAIGETWDDIKEKADQIFDGVSEKVNGAWSGIKEAAETAWEGITTTLETWWGNIKGKAEDVFDGVPSLVQGAWDTILTSASTSWDSIKTALTGAWDGISSAAQTVFGTLGETVSNALNGIKEAAGQISETLIATAQAAYNKAKEIVGNVASGISEGVERVRTAAESIVSSVIGKLGEAIQSAKEKGSQIAQSIGNGLSEAAHNIGNAMQGALNNIWGVLENAVGSAWGYGQRIAESIGNGISSMIGWVQEKANALVDGAKQKFEEAKNVMMEVGKEIGDNVAEGIDNATEAVTNTAKGVAEKAAEVIEGVGQKFDSAGQVVMNYLGNGMNNAGYAVLDLSKNIANEASNAASNTAEKFSETGRDLVDGMANGIKNAGQNAVNAMSDVAGNMIGTVNSMYQIQSPSKVMAGIGQNIIQGLANGVSDNQHISIEATSKLAEEIINRILKILEPTYGKDLINKFAEEIRNDSETAYNSAHSLRERISSAFDKSEDIGSRASDGIISGITGTIDYKTQYAVDRLGRLAHDMSKSLADGINNNSELSLQQARKLEKDIEYELTKLTKGNYGQLVASSIGDELRKSSVIARDGAKRLRENVSSAFDRIGDIGSYAGYNIIDSFNNKLSRDGNSTVRKMKEWGSNIADALKDALGISSPSKVFAGFGRNVVEGMNQGIERMSKSTEDVINEWVDKFTDVEAKINIKPHINDIKGLKPNYGAEIDLQRTYAMQNNVSIDGSEIKNLVHAIEMMSMQDHADMRQQTEYLQQIAKKEFSVGKREVFSAVQSEAASYEMRTGQPAFGWN